MDEDTGSCTDIPPCEKEKQHLTSHHPHSGKLAEGKKCDVSWIQRGYVKAIFGGGGLTKGKCNF